MYVVFIVGKVIVCFLRKNYKQTVVISLHNNNNCHVFIDNEYQFKLTKLQF